MNARLYLNKQQVAFIIHSKQISKISIRKCRGIARIRNKPQPVAFMGQQESESNHSLLHSYLRKSFPVRPAGLQAFLQKIRPLPCFFSPKLPLPSSLYPLPPYPVPIFFGKPLLALLFLTSAAWPSNHQHGPCHLHASPCSSSPMSGRGPPTCLGCCQLLVMRRHPSNVIKTFKKTKSPPALQKGSTPP